MDPEASESQTSFSETSPSACSSKELVARALRGMSIPRPACGPLVVHYCATLAGVSLSEYTLNPRALADCVLRYCEAFRPDAVWLSADTWVNAQAMGATVGFPSANQPMAGIGGPCVRTAADIDRIPPPDPTTQGRWPLMLEALRLVRSALGDEVFIVACHDQYPFSLACALLGIEHAMAQIKNDRLMLDALMEKCVDYTVAYGAALAEAGADMLSGGDSPAGLIGPQSYREVALPFEQRVVRELKKRIDIPVSLHICGNTTSLLADMAASGANVLELDHHIDMVAACRLIGPEIAIWGNLDPVGLLVQGTPEQVRQKTFDLLKTFAACGRKRFVISSGCTLPPDTPRANLQALFDAVHDDFS